MGGQVNRRTALITLASGLALLPENTLASHLYRRLCRLGVSISGGAGCSVTPAHECPTNDAISMMGYNADNWYLGLIVESGQTTISVCETMCQMGTNEGDTGGIVYEASIWNLDGSNNLVPSSGSFAGDDAAGVATSGGQAGGFATGVGEPVRFSFSPAVNLAVGQALVVSRQGSPDSSNYVRVYRATADGDGSYSHYGRWNNDGVIQANLTAQDIHYAIYASS
jgi:hypothetical protein